MSTPKLKMLFSVIRRRFASSVHELGAKLNVESVKTTGTQKFYELRTLPDIEAVKQAPEGSVVVSDSEVPTEYEKSQKMSSHYDEMIQSFKQLESNNASRFARLELNLKTQFEAEILNLKTQFEEKNLKFEAEILKLNNDIKTLKMDVKELKIIPPAMQIYETISKYEQVLIRKYLPDIYVVLDKKNIKFNFLRGKDSQLIRNFFKLSHVGKLDTFISSKEFRKVVDFRNKKTYEAISDIGLLMDDFKDISGYFQSVSEDFNSESFKFEDIKDIHDHVQELEENDEHEP